MALWSLKVPSQQQMSVWEKVPSQQHCLLKIPCFQTGLELRYEQSFKLPMYPLGSHPSPFFSLPQIHQNAGEAWKSSQMVPLSSSFGSYKNALLDLQTIHLPSILHQFPWWYLCTFLGNQLWKNFRLYCLRISWNFLQILFIAWLQQVWSPTLYLLHSPWIDHPPRMHLPLSIVKIISPILDSA